MKAGRELDALIARHVFGIACQPVRVLTGSGFRDDIGYVEPARVMHDGREGVEAKAIPHYSTDIAAAMTVVEQMRPKSFVRMDIGHAINVQTYTPGYEETRAETLPLAIGLAALKVFKVAVPA